MTVAPFVKRSNKNGVDPAKVFRSLGPKETDMDDPTRLVHVGLSMGLCMILPLAEGPFFGVHVGEKFNVLSFPYFQLAKDALSMTNDSVAEIGRWFGFGEAGSFTRFLKSKAGVSPRELRISHK